MKRYSAICMVVCLVLVVQDLGIAQHSLQLTDSELQKKLSSSTGFEKIELLHDLTSKATFQDINLAIEYAEEALDLSKAIQNDSLIAESQYYLALAVAFTEDKARAIENYIDARIIFQRLDYRRSEIKIIQSLGSLYAEISEYEKASQLYFESLEYSRELGNESGVVFSLTKLGMIQQHLGEYRIAKRFLDDAIQKAQEVDDWGGETIALSEAGFLEGRSGDPEKAAGYFKKAIDIFNEKGVRHAIPQLMFNLARIYKDEDQLNEALAIAKDAISLADSLGNTFLVLHSLDEVAEIYHELGEYRKAISILEEGIKKSREVGMSSSTLFLLNKISGSYFKEGELDKSLKSSEEAKELAISSGDWQSAEQALLSLIEIQTEKGNFRIVVALHEELSTVQDSILTEERAKNILEFEARFRIGEKEQEIAELELENEKRAFTQASLIGGILLLFIIGFLIVRSQRLKIKSGKVELEVSELRQKELQRDLEFKNKQLTTQSLNMVQKNEMMGELKEKVENLKKGMSIKELNSLSQLVDYSFNLDEDWKQFQMHFEDVHSSFYHILKERYDDLTPNEMRLSALVKLNLTIKEMAAILGISPDSVKTARYRLRKKLGLNTEDNLSEFMLQLEKDSLKIT